MTEICRKFDRTGRTSQAPPPLGNPWAFELLKIVLFKFPSVWAKIVLHLSAKFDDQPFRKDKISDRYFQYSSTKLQNMNVFEIFF